MKIVIVINLKSVECYYEYKLYILTYKVQNSSCTFILQFAYIISNISKMNMFISVLKTRHFTDFYDK